MRFDDFRALIARMTDDVPAHYLDGVYGIEVSRTTVPHPTRGDVYTLGECIPLDTGTDAVQSRVVLYYGSFHALATERPDFDWRAEAWETLTHELRHHLEWRAHTDRLGAYDWAAEQNFARQEGERFDPVFHLSGERIDADLYKVDDDFFLDRLVDRVPEWMTLAWHGQHYRVDITGDVPLFVTLDGLIHPPPGEVVLVVRRRAGILDAFRRPPAPTAVRQVARAFPAVADP
ncbi:MAG TPA: metallopeptidase family protein [Gemmatimonadales bacterium]|jgi:hypothetical protein